ncbi:MAG: efflux RND transporter periplasmic adaptor subunit [Gemmatimonadaceae bacterium]|nr:efflux RND transporter periplasmic adaptor subunit [Gemmatimonadaceae bacterium]
MSTTMRITIASIGLAVAAGAGWWWRTARQDSAPTWRTAAVESGDIRASVSATGALSAVRTVEVGTQVSGQIAELYADFNDRVKKGQLVARIDPVLQKQAVQDAEAGLARSQAQLAQAKEEFERTSALHAEKIVTETEFNTARTNFALARSNLASAEIGIERAKQNLAYTNIYAPIDGVVIERSIDVGQTVAASLSAPKLFVIANDLSRMQILASVDESDIGSIEKGQRAEFTVQAFQNRRYSGNVDEVRLASTTANNVVSYTVVVSVDNPDGTLLPGMTATVNFITGEAENVLSVPNTALRFRPPTADTSARPAGAPAGARPAGERPTGQRPQGAPNGPRQRMGTVYTLQGDSLVAHRVRVGLSDGTRTAISGEGITAGMQIVIGAGTGGTTAAGGTANNPFQPQQQGGQRRPGPPTPF